MDTMTRLENDLTDLLNCHSAEYLSNTPDFLLAKFLMACLTAYNQTVRARELWYDDSPALISLVEKDA